MAVSGTETQTDHPAALEGAEGLAEASEQASTSGHGGSAIDPIHQFTVTSLFEGVPFFTNSALYMLLSVASIVLLIYLGTRKARRVPTRLQVVVEAWYRLVATLTSDIIGKESRFYLPFLFTLFSYILFCNLWGLTPYSFTVTSHLIVTFALAMVVWGMSVFLGFYKHGLGFFKFFAPSGVPIVMLPFLIVIELISFLFRPITLSMRLFANMLAGHALLKVLASFIPLLGIFGVLPFAAITLITGLETFVAFLQAYVFVILASVYINDGLHLH